MRLRDLTRGLVDRVSRDEPVADLPEHDMPRRHKERVPHPGLENLVQEAEMADPVGTTLEPTAPPQQVQHLAIAGQDIRRKAKDEPGFEVDKLVTGSGGNELDLVGNSESPDDDLVLPGEGDGL